MVKNAQFLLSLPADWRLKQKKVHISFSHFNYYCFTVFFFYVFSYILSWMITFYYIFSVSGLCSVRPKATCLIFVCSFFIYAGFLFLSHDKSPVSFFVAVRSPTLLLLQWSAVVLSLLCSLWCSFSGLLEIHLGLQRCLLVLFLVLLILLERDTSDDKTDAGNIFSPVEAQNPPTELKKSF